MPGDIIMTKGQEGERSKLNKSEPQINRGVELLLRNKRRRESKPPYLHPEFFDENGRVIPDEIVSVRFENSDYDYDDYEDEEED